MTADEHAELLSLMFNARLQKPLTKEEVADLRYLIGNGLRNHLTEETEELRLATKAILLADQDLRLISHQDLQSAIAKLELQLLK